MSLFYFITNLREPDKSFQEQDYLKISLGLKKKNPIENTWK